MSKTSRASWSIATALTLAIGAGAALVIEHAATVQREEAIEATMRDYAALATVKTCFHEDGASPDNITGLAQTYPCAWTGRGRGFRQGITLLYVRGSDGGCFRHLPAGVVCYDVEAEWFDGDVKAADAELAH